VSGLISYRVSPIDPLVSDIVVRATVIGFYTMTESGYWFGLPGDEELYGPMPRESLVARLAVLEAAVLSADEAKPARGEWADKPCDGCLGHPGRWVSPVINALSGMPSSSGPCFRCRDGCAHGKPGVQTPVDQRRNYGHDHFGPKAQLVKAAAAAAITEALNAS
jgi:hypothetical protein